MYIYIYIYYIYILYVYIYIFSLASYIAINAMYSLIFTKNSDMLNKNTYGAKKARSIRSSSYLTIHATKSFDIS